ncbi:unnamed protein product [Jaminaea pallidilutea]
MAHARKAAGSAPSKMHLASLPECLPSGSNVTDMEQMPTLEELRELSLGLQNYKSTLVRRTKQVVDGHSEAMSLARSTRGSVDSVGKDIRTRRQSSSTPAPASQSHATRRSVSPSNAEQSIAGSSGSVTSAKGKGREVVREESPSRTKYPRNDQRGRAPTSNSEQPKIRIKRESSFGLSTTSSASEFSRDSPARNTSGSSALEDRALQNTDSTFAKTKRKRRSVSMDDNRHGELTEESRVEQPVMEQSVEAGHRGRNESLSVAADDSALSPAAKDPSSPSLGASRPRQLGIRLKLKPTAAPSGITALGAAHRPSALNGDQRQSSFVNDRASAALWALPEETPATTIPPRPISRPPKPYLTEPSDVNEDFTSMDWKERERFRDYEEALLHSHSVSASPTPGQLQLQKETPNISGVPGGAIGSAAANRVRSQNQQQVSYQAFQTYVDGWFKTLTEEDVAWLGRADADGEAFQAPAFGRHYRDIWEEEDAEGGPSLYPAPLRGVATGESEVSHSGRTIKTPAFEPRSLANEHALGLTSDDAHGGSFTERILSMILPVDSVSGSSQSSTQAPISKEDSNLHGSAAGPRFSNEAVNEHTPFHKPRTQDMAQYEERIKKELRFLDILGEGEEVDWPNRQDDEVSSTLRKVQTLLSKQTSVNERRKARLRDIAMDRLAYQDYASCLANVEKLIEQGWLKRQTLLKKLISKKKNRQPETSANSAARSDGDRNAGPPTSSVRAPLIQESITGNGSDAAAVSNTAPAHTAAATGEGSYSATGISHLSNRLAVPPLADSLVSAIQKRRDLQAAFEPMFSEMPHAKKTPSSSVFADLNVEVD